MQELSLLLALSRELALIINRYPYCRATGWASRPLFFFHASHRINSERRHMDASLSSLSSPLLEQVERGREARRRLYGRLCRLGVMLRLLTFLNAFALIGAAGYSLYASGLDEFQDASLSVESRVRSAVELVLMAGSGLFLFCLEQSATTNEAEARSSFGVAFSGGGRLFLLMCLALISAPAVHSGRSRLELYSSGGAVVFLFASALLQAWMLSCTPEYRSHVVAELDTPKVTVDSTAFPQIYQRDEGAHLHLGVLLPGFASRDNCTMAANCSNITLVGDIAHLEAPFSPVRTRPARSARDAAKPQRWHHAMSKRSVCTSWRGQWCAVAAGCRVFSDVRELDRATPSHSHPHSFDET